MIDIGDELPELSVDLSAEFVAGYARGIGMDFGRFTDAAQARAEGLPGQIAPGNLSLALIARALLHWRPGVRIRKLGTTFRAPVVAGQTVHVRGNVTERREIPGGGSAIGCDVWMESAEGDRLVIGTALVETAPACS